MLLFCPNCGRRFEIPSHMEADAAHKCPSCGSEFGGPKPREEEPPVPGGKFRFTSGGETDAAVAVAGGGRGVPVTRGAPPTRASPLPGISRPARRVDPAACELGAALGRVGAGILYQARDPASGEDVLVRQLLPEGGAVVDAERWAAAATQLQGLTHTRIATVLGVGLRDGSPHVVTERIDGQNLAEVAGGHPLNLRQATQFSLQIVEALTAAHGSGVLHGDLKPSNVIVDPQGRVRVCDFGFFPRARDDRGEPAEGPHVLGWLPFAPPEAVRDGPEAITERSDSYGLGALLYFMLTGRPPFVGDDAKTLVTNVLEGAPPSPGSINRKLSPALDTFVMRTLEKDPSHRPSNAQSVALELRKIEREARAAQAPERLRPSRVRGAFRVLVALLLLAGLGYGGYYMYNELRLKGALGRAQGYAEEARKLLASRSKDRPERDAEIHDKAVGLYRNAVEEAEGTPELPKLQLELAKLLRDLDRPGEVADLLAELLAKVEASLPAKLLKGAAGPEVPEAAEARLLLPPALARAGRGGEAASALRKLDAAGAAEKAILKAGLATGEALLGAGSGEGAREVFEYLSEVAAKVGDPALGVKAALGDSYAALDEKEKARRTFAGVLEAAKGDAAARARAALGLVRLIEPRDLEFELTADEEEAISAFPLARALYVRLLVARGLPDRAGLIIEKPLPESPVVGSGTLTGRRGLDAAARAWVELAHGEVLEARGSLEEARSRFAEAERLSGETPDLPPRRASAEVYQPWLVAGLARVGLARLSLRTGRTAPALARFRDCVDRYTGRPEARAAVAWALVGQADALRLMGRLDEAARQYREVTGTIYEALREQYLVALCGLGEVTMEIRDRVRMRSAFKRLAAQTDAGFYGEIARAMLGETTGAAKDELVDDLIRAAARQRRDLAARAYYCIALKRDLADDAEGAREMLRRVVDTAAGLSWYGVAAERRLKR